MRKKDKKVLLIFFLVVIGLIGLRFLYLALGGYDVGGSGASPIVYLILGIIYFIPMIIAIKRHHRNTGAIVIINILLGWTLIGWIIAFVMAVWQEKT